ncbi:MAG: DegV family protein [Lachnospiraceae bacterium]|nr:DegV family protein [Lachnospiraceae bacterium]
MSKKIAVITDSNSGITQSEAKELGIKVIPMPFMIDGVEFLEDINLTQEEFYEKLMGDCSISTSQPGPETVLDFWDQALKEYDEVVHIPMSSGLSGSFQTARMLAEDYEGRVQPVNNQRISVTMRQSVMDAIKLASEGFDAAQIKEKLEEDKFNSSIYICLDTLEYLKRGGRLTPAAALLGSLLKIKPILQIQGEKLDKFATCRTIAKAKTVMIDQARKDILERFGGSETGARVYISVAYTYNEDNAKSFVEDIKEAFPDATLSFVDKLSLSVSCHIGPGALAIAITKKTF